MFGRKDSNRPPIGVCASCKGLIEDKDNLTKVDARPPDISDWTEYTFCKDCWNDVANTLVR